MGYPLYVHVGQEADVGKEEKELGDADDDDGGDVLLVPDEGVVVGHGEQGEQVEEEEENGEDTEPGPHRVHAQEREHQLSHGEQHLQAALWIRIQLDRELIPGSGC